MKCYTYSLKNKFYYQKDQNFGGNFYIIDVHKVPLTCSSSIVSKILTEVEVQFQLFLYSNC